MEGIVGELADRQHGVVARRQLLELGIGPRAISARMARGYLRPVHLGVYAVGHTVLTSRARWMAAVLACGPGAVLSHRSAAVLWGLLDTSGQPEAIRPGKFRPRRGIVARFGTVPADERTIRDGIPVTTVPRTILDLAGMGRYPRREGAPILHELLAEDVRFRGAPINRFEDRFADLLDCHRLTRPRFNPDLVVSGRHFKPDCLWSQEKLIVELDGAETLRRLLNPIRPASSPK